MDDNELQAVAWRYEFRLKLAAIVAMATVVVGVIWAIAWADVNRRAEQPAAQVEEGMSW